jgi:hypothetical protein
MSKKWTPSISKDQQQGQNTNYFASLVNTSLPAKEAPKLAPATLASLTSKNGANQPVQPVVGGSSRSFAAKLAEQERSANDPNYVPPPKVLNFNSDNDFPTLGGPKKNNNNVRPAPAQPRPVAPVTNGSFADLAKGWAKATQREEEKARRKALRAEARRREMELMRNMPTFNLMRRRQQEEYDDEEDYNPTYEEDNYLGESDSFEMESSEEEMPEEEQENEEDQEFNQNAVWDGRRRDDLY